jgi:group I intron endonuclease
MIIYKVTNLINNKIYIGMTTYNLNVRKSAHYTCLKNNKSGKFQKALLKYPKENFIWEQIDTANTIEELKQKEIYWIEQYDSYKHGYNSTLGGDTPWNLGFLCSEETKKKISLWNKENNAFRGKHHSNETKNILRDIFLTPYNDVITMFEQENYQVLTPENEYQDLSHKIKVICPNGHNWNALPYKFKDGTRCIECKRLSSKIKYEEIIRNFNEYNYIVHSTKEEYEKYKGQFKFNVTCDKGHNSNILYMNFKNGHRCKQCAIDKQILTGSNKHYKKIDSSTINHIKKLYQEGHNFSMIGRKTNLDSRLVKRRLQQEGLI